MALMDEILTWSESDLSEWKRDALRRLLNTSGTLSESDYDELYAMLLAQNGVVTESPPTPVPLDESHIPTDPAQAEHVELIALRDLKNVNRLATDQNLSFAPKGLTIIFGGNGSGKSGYARVLKKACRARERTENLYSDLSDASTARLTPEARFDIRVGDAPMEVRWTASQSTPEELSTISLFDSSCAKIFLRENHDVAYLPYGLDIVKALADEVLPALSKRVNDDLRSLKIDTTPFQSINPNTRAGALADGLSYQSDAGELTDLATLSDTEVNRHAELSRTLAVDSPRKRGDEYIRAARRLKVSAETIREKCKPLSEGALTELQEVLIGMTSAKEAARATVDLLNSGEELLDGTGGDTWKELFKVARQFAVESDYTDEQGWLRKGVSDKCVLCQQPHDHASSQRLDRFQRFLIDKTETTLAERLAVFNQKKQQLIQLRIEFDPTSILKPELEELDAELSADLFSFEATTQTKHASLLAGLESNEIPENVSADWGPLHCRVRKLAAAQLRRARTLYQADDPRSRASLEAEKVELDSRVQLHEMISSVLSCVHQMQRKNQLKQCDNELKTKPISAKVGEFTRNYVSNELLTKLNEEFGRLGVREVEIVVDASVRSGNPKQSLKLCFPASVPNVKLEEILSEGQQRVIALASFFAELKLANHNGGICLDDPVSSLDHDRRHLVAKRLVEEAQHRQVIVFTHDATFLGQLRDQIDRTTIPQKIQHLEWHARKPGHIKEGLPWDQQGYSHRIDGLEKAQRRMLREWGTSIPNSDQNQEMRNWYSKFRATIERVVQDVVLAGTVKRFSDYVRPPQLEQVIRGFASSENAVIQYLYQRCNDVTDAHDASSDGMSSPPTPQEFKDDIDELKSVISRIKSRRKSGGG